MYWKVLTHDYRPPLQGGAPLCDGLTWPVVLPTVPLDRSASECGIGGGWHFTRDIETALEIAGIWPTGWPSAVVAVDPHGDIVERAGKCRAASLTLLRCATDTEIADAITRFSAVFAPHQEVMAREQVAWRGALARPFRNPDEVEIALRVALKVRGLDWTTKRFTTAWAARDAWDALSFQFAALMNWIKQEPDLLTVGIRHAHYNGMELAVPTGPNELGWAMATP